MVTRYHDLEAFSEPKGKTFTKGKRDGKDKCGLGKAFRGGHISATFYPTSASSKNEFLSGLSG